MSSFCLISHEPAPAGPCLELARALAARGDRVTILETGGRDGSAAGDSAFRHLDEVAPAGNRAVFPAVSSHRLALRVREALAELRPDAAVFFGHPAHASASVAGRACGMDPHRIAVVFDTLGQYRREAEQCFPADGREAIATEFLERQALAGADSLACLDPKVSSWLSDRGWALPKLQAADALQAALQAAGQRTPQRHLSLPPVSVCVAYYEHPAFLGDALASLAAQTKAALEVIVVDDGSKSPEARAAFAKAEAEYSPRGWRFLRQANAGPAVARNRAAQEARGEAVLFCDADNRFHPDMIGTLALALVSTGADCVTCGFNAEPDGDGPPAGGGGYRFIPLGPCDELALVENVLGDTNFIARRDRFLLLGGFPTDNRAASEDWQFLLRIALGAGRLASVPAALFDYRLVRGSNARSHSELASAAAASAPAFEGALPVWRRIWPHLAGLVRDPRVERLGEELAASRTAHLREAQAWAQRDRIRRSSLFLLETSQRTLDELLRTAREEAADRRRRDAREIEDLSRRAAELESAKDRAEDKVRRMQASFSWKATAPLRALRRALLPTPAQAPAGAAAPSSAPPEKFFFNIDAPRAWRRQSGPLAIRGWCFGEDPAAIGALRARVGGRIHEGVCGLDRPDLLRAHPDRPQCAKSGFKVELLLLPDDPAVVLEAQGPDGRWRPFLEKTLNSPDSAAEPGSYEHWVKTYDTLSAAELESVRAAARALSPAPKISVLMPVFNPPELWLERAIQSVRDQAYPHWELCIADDASTRPKVREIIERAALEDPRIRAVFHEKNGHICEATNSALALAGGEYAALFDHDDELAPHALYCVAAEIVRNPGTQLIYSDEDKIDEQGTRFDPHFKPDWNPELLLGQNYVSHLAVFRTETLRGLGGLRPGLEGSQDWDLVLRLSEKVPAVAIRHIPRVLYHWRAGEGSTALSLGEKGYAADSGRRAVADHLARTGRPAPILPTVGGHWRIAHPSPPQPPLVSIIIPTHNAAGLVRVCVASIIARTDYTPFEIVLVNNRSDDPAALALFAELEREDGVRVLDYDEPFNYSAITNFAAERARGSVLCLLNNDIEILSTGWLGELVSQAVRPGVGAVGARLYYPDMRLQHAGVITGIGGVAGHAFKGFGRNDPGTPQFRPHLAQNVSVVTAACLAIRKSVFFEAGGFDAERLPVAFNDVDFCLKVEARGYRNVYTPFAELIHHESASRGQENTPEKVRRFQGEIAAIQERWGARLLNDPAYNPNLSLDSEDFSLSCPPRTPPLP